ncbi:Sucrase/ferredoxin-like-domain-containing protein [Dipodascopsis uninucleata]
MQKIIYRCRLDISKDLNFISNRPYKFGAIIHRCRDGLSKMKSFSSESRPQNRIIDKCPPPSYDTGCTYCRPLYPKDSPVKNGALLRGTAPMIHRHIIVCTGSEEWPSKIEADVSSLQSKIRALQFGGLRRDPDFTYMVTSSTLPKDPRAKSDEYSLYIYPDGVYIPRLQPSQIELFMKRYLIPSYLEEARNFEEVTETRSGQYPLVGICGHASRDIRCGIAGPMLYAEFDQVLEKSGLLYNEVARKGVRLALVSHIGGHAYAGNLVYFGPKGSSIWYGLTQPKHVQGIVKETIENGNIINELFRGSMGLDGL